MLLKKRGESCDMQRIPLLQLQELLRLPVYFLRFFLSVPFWLRP